MPELSLLAMKFNKTAGAASALDGLRMQGAAFPWLEEVGVIERHESGRVSMRGTYEGYYFGAEEGDDPMAGAALGGLTGSLIGLIGGPAGFVIGGLLGTGAGAATGKAVEKDSDEGRAYEEIKRVLEKGTSALILIAARPTLDEFSAAFAEAALETSLDQAISDEEATRLAEALQSS